MEKEKRKDTLADKAKGLPSFSSSFKKDLSFEKEGVTSHEKILDPKSRKSLKSAVIESLIQQNEDLGARLTVSHRRISLLEEEIAEMRAKTEETNILKDQYLVLKEKLRSTLERKQEASSRLDDLEESLKKQEISYSELYSDYKKQDQENKDLSQRLNSFENYKRRTRGAYVFLKEKNKELTKTTENQEKTIKDHEQRKKTLESNINQATNYIQQQGKENQKQVQELKKDFNEEKKMLLNQIEELLSKKEELQQKAAHIDSVYKENVKLQNELLFSKGATKDKVKEFEGESEDLRKQMAEKVGHIESLERQIRDIQFRLDQANNKKEATKKDNRDLENQFLALQSVLRQVQSQLEEKKEQSRSLLNLNKELSVSVANGRRQVQDLKSEIEEVKKGYEEKIKTLQETILERSP